MSSSLGNIPATLEILALEVECIIGDLPFERVTPQKVSFDISLTIDIAQVAQSDDIAHTVNYVEAAEIVAQVAVEGQFKMIETLAARVAIALKERYAMVQQVQVRLSKNGTIPGAKGAKITVSL